MKSTEDIIIDAIRAACPDPDVDCLNDEEDCFKLHPIHPAGSSNGVIVSIYADVDGLATVIADALNKAGTHQ